jgi:hypothetical protein
LAAAAAAAAATSFLPFGFWRRWVSARPPAILGAFAQIATSGPAAVLAVYI